MLSQSAIARLKAEVAALKEQLSDKTQQCVALESKNNVLRDERDQMQSALTKAKVCHAHDVLQLGFACEPFNFHSRANRLT